ncbi:MAG: outer membrane protein assembly factor BamA [Herminiimonas sp.]|nr:outer membrane protein assembly factor BamA [Herminiimonas sp.]
MKLHSPRFVVPFFPRRLIALAAMALCAGPTLAVEPFVVKDIRVEGIQRTEAGTVFSYLPVRVGETFTDDKAAAAIKALYATGFFKDVRIEADGDVLVVLIEERPAIAKVDFTGAKEFDKDVLTKALKEIGLGEARIYDKSVVDRAEQELKRQYLSKGLYGVAITTTVTPIERNRVNITFAIDEGEVSRIRQINIVGNKAFNDKELLRAISLTTPGWFTWYTKSDQYSKQKLTGDIEALKSYYLNRGYLEMEIESTQVSITPDKKDIYITVNIKEGEKYTVSDVKLEGETFGRQEELKSLVLLKKGEVYNGELLAESVKRISERLGNFGYAFANVNTNPELNREKKEVSFTVLIDPGKRVYIRKINVAGNTKTRDEVVRREFRAFESSWYDGAKIRLSRDRVDRLGYFKEVTMETPEVPGTTDQIDVNMAVVEKPTGNILIGAGFSSSEKLTLTGSIQQTNAFGSGDTIGVEVNTSRRNRTIAFSEVNPYFTDNGLSRSYELYVRTTRPPQINAGDYVVRTLGGNIKFGVPFSELDTVFFGLGVERTRIETFLNQPNEINSPQIYLNYVAAFGDGVNATTTSFPLTVAWQRDSRDSALTPSAGRYQRANFELAPFGDLRYYRAIYQQQYYKPFFKVVTLALNGEVDYGRGFAGKPYPIFKNFYAGGIGSVRGYDSASLGDARDPLTGDSLGGSKRIIMNAELQFPFPGQGNDRSLRWFVFSDGGNVFAEKQKIRATDLRFSAGIGFSWVSPVGPLKLSYGKPLNLKQGDRPQSFQFQLGTGF